MQASQRSTVPQHAQNILQAEEKIIYLKLQMFQTWYFLSLSNFNLVYDTKT